MRETKFRAWVPEENDMFYLGELFCWERGYHNPEFVKVLGGSLTEKNLGMISTENNKYQEESRKRFVLMQCTGLKDKNGKEIYEGDVLFSRFESGDKKIEYRSVVEFSSDRAAFVLRKHRFFSEYLSCAKCKERSEVIGNIHQDPHLS